MSKSSADIFRRKAVKNCRSLNMQTIRLRREKPSSLALALALAITMLVVYLLSLQGCPEEDAEAAAMQAASEIRMEAMDAGFLLSSIHDDRTMANVAAAMCAQSGGAGLVLRKGEQFAVVQEAGGDFSSEDAPVIRRSAAGLTLEIGGPAGTVKAAGEAITLLRALADETGALAASLEAGESDGRTIRALMGVYRTSAEGAMEGVGGCAALNSLESALRASIERIDAVLDDPSPGRIRLLHAAGCLEWIAFAERLRSMAEA